ncbi:MAG: hypothetical protein PHR16_16655 [Methylovulum sp.]|nr:hypothetical protein [Methylovulum sp.]
MSEMLPLNFRYEGEGQMTVVGPKGKATADRQYVIGEIYRMVEEKERSEISHDHQFAWLHGAWLNLPEDIADQYPTETHLRKRALVQAGFYTEQIIDAGSTAAALRVAAGIRSREEFSLIIVRGQVVVIRDPISQKKKLMGAAEFQRSKQAILEIISAMIGVAPGDLEKQAGKAA